METGARWPRRTTQAGSCPAVFLRVELMGQPFIVQRRVEFRDTDAAGMMHFSAFFVYMEQAEHELMRSLDASIVQHEGEDVFSWPRAAARCDYRSAFRFEDLIRMEVRVTRLGRTSENTSNSASRSRPMTSRVRL